MDKKFFLVGMPASGKSTIGKVVAAQLGYRFIDLDKVIVQNEGKEITEIFSENGEDYFRVVEQKCLNQILDLNVPLVLATGGGAPCFFDNMKKMNKAGTTIFLDVPIEDLVNKLKTKGTKKRPLLKDIAHEGLELELLKKYEHRKKFFEQSDISLRQNFGDTAERVNQVILAIRSLEE